MIKNEELLKIVIRDKTNKVLSSQLSEFFVDLVKTNPFAYYNSMVT